MFCRKPIRRAHDSWNPALVHRRNRDNETSVAYRRSGVSVEDAVAHGGGDDAAHGKLACRRRCHGAADDGELGRCVVFYLPVAVDDAVDGSDDGRKGCQSGGKGIESGVGVLLL